MFQHGHLLEYKWLRIPPFVTRPAKIYRVYLHINMSENPQMIISGFVKVGIKSLLLAEKVIPMYWYADTITMECMLRWTVTHKKNLN